MRKKRLWGKSVSHTELETDQRKNMETRVWWSEMTRVVKYSLSRLSVETHGLLSLSQEPTLIQVLYIHKWTGTLQLITGSTPARSTYMYVNIIVLADSSERAPCRLPRLYLERAHNPGSTWPPAQQSSATALFPWRERAVDVTEMTL